jgi:CTP:molybdopterin cytidylyltransferase MocA
VSTPLGIVLAAGAGRRYGEPKAFARDDSGRTWLERACAVLLDGGCPEVVATVPVVGALPALDTRVRPLRVAADGLSDSLDAALAVAIERGADAVLVMLVDLPDVTAEVVGRVASADADLARATYAGRPGHPVLITAAHLAPLRSALGGDSGANAYLAAHGVAGVECGDLATGHDVDRPVDRADAEPER